MLALCILLVWSACLVPVSAVGSGAVITGDAFVAGGTLAATPLGTSTELQLFYSGDTSLARKVYLQFDLSGVTETIIDASLSLTTKTGFPSGSFNFTYFGLNDLNAGESWSQNSITWNNAPANQSASPGFDFSSVTDLGSEFYSSLSMGQTVQFANADSDGGTALVDFLVSDTNDTVTFMVYATLTGSSLGFYSIEGGTAPPLLQVTTAPIPEPAAAAVLLSLAALALVGLRNRL